MATSLLSGAALSACAARAAAPIAQSGAWPMYQDGPTHNAVVARHAFSATWSYRAPGRINGGLAVVGNTVFVDTLHGDVLALDLRTGKPRWHKRVDNAAMSTPVETNGLVIVGTGTNAGGQHDSRFAYASDPGRALPVWGRAAGDHVIAFAATSGRRVWIYRTAGEDMPSPALSYGRLVFANGDYHAYGLGVRSGTARWRDNLKGIATMGSASAIGHGRVLLSTCTDFAARATTVMLDAATGRVLWRVPYGNCDASPTLGADRVFLSGEVGGASRVGYRMRAIIAAVDPATGRLLWRHEMRRAGLLSTVGSSERAISGTFAGNTYLQPLPSTDEIVAFQRDGTVRWRFRTVAPVKMSPVETNGRVYFGDTAGLLYALDAKTGALRWSQPFRYPFAASPPVIVGQTLLVADGSTLRAMPLPARRG